jgi:TM2 domain-containing membrane protein YozV
VNYVNCPHCFKPIAQSPELAGQFISCPRPQCGRFVAMPAEMRAREILPAIEPPPVQMTADRPHHQHPVYVIQQDSGASAMVAALLSLFMPGLGQMCQGRAGTGVAFFAGWIVSWALCLFLIGFILVPLVWVIAIVEAATYKK